MDAASQTGLGAGQRRGRDWANRGEWETREWVIWRESRVGACPLWGICEEGWQRTKWRNEEKMCNVPLFLGQRRQTKGEVFAPEKGIIRDEVSQFTRLVCSETSRRRWIIFLYFLYLSSDSAQFIADTRSALDAQTSQYVTKIHRNWTAFKIGPKNGDQISSTRETYAAQWRASGNLLFSPALFEDREDERLWIMERVQRVGHGDDWGTTSMPQLIAAVFSSIDSAWTTNPIGGIKSILWETIRTRLSTTVMMDTVSLFLWYILLRDAKLTKNCEISEVF